MVPTHLNMTLALGYLGGVTSGNLPMGIFLGLGTAGVMVLNCVTAWMSWATNQREGYGVFQFFFFGWRTLSPGWHKFLLAWQIGDSVFALVFLGLAISVPVIVSKIDKENHYSMRASAYFSTVVAIPAGAAGMLVLGFPLILWVELIVARNHIESETEMVSIWIFVAQVVAMLIPKVASVLGFAKLPWLNCGCFREKDDDAGVNMGNASNKITNSAV